MNRNNDIHIYITRDRNRDIIIGTHINRTYTWHKHGQIYEQKYE